MELQKHQKKYNIKPTAAPLAFQNFVKPLKLSKKEKMQIEQPLKNKFDACAPTTNSFFGDIGGSSFQINNKKTKKGSKLMVNMTKEMQSIEKKLNVILSNLIDIYLGKSRASFEFILSDVTRAVVSIQENDLQPI